MTCGSNGNAQTVSREPAPAAEKIPLSIQVLDLIVRFLGIVVWPALLFGFMLLFRKPLGRLIDRIKSLNWGDKGAEFAAGVEEAEEKAELEPPPEAAIAAVRQTATMGYPDPRTSILEAWLQVEPAIQAVVVARNLAPDYTRIQSRPLTALRLIENAGLIDKKYVNLFQDLRTLRNEAAHAAEFNPTP